MERGTDEASESTENVSLLESEARVSAGDGVDERGGSPHGW
jgi:hypothetical protein